MKRLKAVRPASPAQKEQIAPVKKTRYAESVGRRKTAVARVRITKGTGKFVLNDKTVESYFPTARLRQFATSPLSRLQMTDKLDLSVKVGGGGVRAQAEAVRHGIARALIVMEPGYKKQLRGFGYLTRDPRMVERKKYGLKKARRAPQWAKR